MLHIEAIDEVYVRIIGDLNIHAELSERFTFTVPGYKFMPAFKSGRWDGKICIYDARTQKIYRGLVHRVLQYARDFEYEVTYDPCLEKDIAQNVVDPEAMARFFYSLNLEFPPRDFQQTGIEHVLEKRRCILESATGSGKSLIIYMLLRALKKKKVLLVVPNITLVNQMYDDFMNYSKNDPTWDVRSEVQKIHGGLDKNVSSRIVVTTWQSVYKSPKEYFKDFGVLLVDECHLAQADSIKLVAEKCSNASYRVGLTGTLQESKCAQMILVGLLGEPITLSRTRDLMDRGILSTLDVRCVYLKYPKAECDIVKGMTYRDELVYSFRHERRNDYLCSLAKECVGNTLILVTEVAEHALPLFSLMKAANPDRQVFLMTGATMPEERERLRKLAETRNDVIFVATYSLFSTGVNIVNLRNVIFGGPAGKSEIRVLQSIGRGLRKGEGKDSAILIDIIDDFSNGKAKKNNLFKHATERSKYYIEQQFDTTFTEIAL